MGIILPGGFPQHKQSQEQGPVCFFKMGVIPIQDKITGELIPVVMNFPCTDECGLYCKIDKCCKVLSTFNGLLSLKENMKELSNGLLELKKLMEVKNV